FGAHCRREPRRTAVTSTRARPKVLHRLWIKVGSGRFFRQGQVELCVPERNLDAVARGRLLVRRPGEVGDEALLDRENRVGVKVGASRDEDVRRQRSVALSLNDEVNVGGAVRVASGRLQQTADRTVCGNRVMAGDNGPETETSLGVGVEKSAAVAGRLNAGLLNVVEPVLVALPHVDFGVGQWSAVGAEDASGNHAR